MSKVKKGLGCDDYVVTAELYKLLIYEKERFFLPHRDTEKAPGMFGTLVISLPCPHKEGEKHPLKMMGIPYYKSKLQSEGKAPKMQRLNWSSDHNNYLND